MRRSSNAVLKVSPGDAVVKGGIDAFISSRQREEKRAMSLMQQLQAIRNEKRAIRKASDDRRRAAAVKRNAKDQAARDAHTKEERKRRYVAEGKAERKRARAAE